MLVLDEQQVRDLLDYPSCISAIDEAQRALSAGEAVMPVRLTLAVELGEMNVMPGSLGGQRGLGAKIVTWAPANAEKGLPTVQAVVLLLDASTGSPLAVIEAAHLTAVRTAAASALATRILASESASTLALIGAGTQARSHLAGMLAVRPISRVQVFSLDDAQAFVESQVEALPNVEFVVATSSQAAVEGADVICTVSLASEPVVKYEWLKPGCHINAVGAHSPDAREIDSETMLRARVIVDSREANLAECGDCLIPIDEGLYGPEHVSDEIGEVLLGTKPGRSTPEEITVYQSCGLAVQDLAVAGLAVKRATQGE